MFLKQNNEANINDIAINDVNINEAKLMKQNE